jgi:outer membrane protein TolC
MREMEVGTGSDLCATAPCQSRFGMGIVVRIFAFAVAAIVLAGGARAQDRFAGSVASGTATSERLPLSLPDAISRGMKTNLGALVANQDVRSAQAARGEALSRLLPNLTAGVYEESQQIDLAAFGFGNVPGFPQVVGPFGLTDARAALSQPILNFKSIYNTRAATVDRKAATLSSQDARDMVALVVTGLYLQAGTARSRIETGRAQVTAAQAVYDQAADFRKNGVVPAIEVLRAQVELQTQQQRLISYQSDAEKLKLRLARAIGLPDGQEFELTDTIPYSPVPSLKLEDAIGRAYTSRMDYQSAEARVTAAELGRKAAEAGRMPTADFNGNYGDIGPAPDRSHGTYSATVSVSVPVFQGGRVRNEVMQADAELERRRAELADLRGRIAYEIRAAYLDLASAGEQTQVAKSTIALAEQQLTQSQDRFAAGVTGNLEVVQAQESVATANENYISSLYVYNAAKATLGRSIGNAEKTIPSILQGGIQ